MVLLLVLFGGPSSVSAHLRLRGVVVRVCTVFIVLELVMVQKLGDSEACLRFEKRGERVLLQT